MSCTKLGKILAAELDTLLKSGIHKGEETAITGVIPATADKGPRYLLAGMGEKPFIRMNSNGYLGLALENAKLLSYFV